MPVVRLRDDLQPDQAYRTMLHELQHVADAVIIAEISEEEAEQRAEAFVARATRRIQNMSEVQLAIASGSGICGACGGVIKPGTPYYRDESGGAGRLACSHMTCPPPAVRLTDRQAMALDRAVQKQVEFVTSLRSFDAGRFLIDRLKEVVPIWKKENWSDGSTEWVHQ